MDDATKEKLNLDTLHNEELLRVEKTQAQARELRKLVLDFEHQAVHDATIARQKALNEQEYEHRKRILQLDHQYASPKIVAELRGSVPESKLETETAGSTREPGAESKERFAQSGNGKSEKTPKKSGSKAEEFLRMAKKAAERRPQ
ncbi:MAG: hypothetical protein Q9161_000422 [Pseudevernia consocians]